MSTSTAPRSGDTPRQVPSQDDHAARPAQRGPGEGPFVRIILGSLAVGALVAAGLMLVGFEAGTEPQITGSALLGFAVSWTLIGWLTTRFTGHPQPWTAVPAGLFGVSGLALVVAAPDAAGMAALSWVWPPLVVGLVAWMWTRMRRQLPRRGRVVLAPVLALLVAASVGAVSENVAVRSVGPATAPGTRFEVAGRALHLDCHGAPVGTDGPTVVLLSGLSGSSPSWALVSAGLQDARVRVCAYDRAGQGWSDPTPRPQSPTEAATDLHAVLAAAGERAPVVLVGHSTGGTYALTYAHAYPREVAGMVLLDSSSPEQAERIPGFTTQLSMMRRVLALAPSMYRLGLGHLVAGGSPLPEPAARRATALATSPGAARNLRDEQAVILDVFAQARAVHTLGHRPLVVVTASENAADPAWASAQDALARLSASAIHVTVRSSHSGLLQDPIPAAAASQAIARVVAAARTGRPVQR